MDEGGWIRYYKDRARRGYVEQGDLRGQNNECGSMDEVCSQAQITDPDHVWRITTGDTWELGRQRSAPPTSADVRSSRRQIAQNPAHPRTTHPDLSKKNILLLHKQIYHCTSIRVSQRVLMALGSLGAEVAGQGHPVGRPECECGQRRIQIYRNASLPIISVVTVL